jgi:hypothetical protein
MPEPCPDRVTLWGFSNDLQNRRGMPKYVGVEALAFDLISCWKLPDLEFIEEISPKLKSYMDCHL